MKKYKLVKDLPTFELGDEFILKEGIGLQHVIEGCDGAIVYTEATLDKFPNILTDWFEEIEEQTRWKPEMDQKYYCFGSDGSVVDDDWCGLSIDHNRSEIGNCFESREEAEKAVERLKAWERLKGAGLKFKDWNKIDYDRTFCINAEVGHDVVAFDFSKDLRTALDMEIDDEA